MPRLRPPGRHGNLSIVVTPDNRHVVAGGWDGLAFIALDELAPPQDLPVDSWCTLAELSAGQRIHEGDLAGLTSDEWLERWQPLHTDHPHYFPLGSGERIAWHRHQTEVAEQARQWSTALVHLAALLADLPNEESLYLRRGRIQAQLGHWQEAVGDFSRAIDLATQDRGVWFSRGEAYLRLADPPKAVLDFTRAIELEPNHAWAWHNRGHANERLGRWDEAFADFSKSIELTPASGNFHRCRGHFHFARRQWEQAVADLGQAVELDAKLTAEGNPRLRADLKERGLALAELGQWEKAAADLGKAAEGKEAGIDVWYGHALVLLGCGDRPAYRRVCSGMRERFRPNAPAENLYWLAWTCVLDQDPPIEPQQLLDLAREAAADKARDHDCQTVLGAALYRAGKLEQAAQQLEEASTLEPNRSSKAYTWFFLAMAQHRLGHADQARQILDKARQEPVQGNDQTMPWNRRLTLQVLRREAEALIEGKKAGPKP
jgi:tetratricopeptide (TPR) repeat protein